MSVTGPELLEAAKLLHRSATSEVSYRNVCGRAYYAVYQDGKAFHDNLPCPGRLSPHSKGGLHADLIERLTNPGISRDSADYRRSTVIGYLMKTLHANRVTADYKREMNIDKLMADNAIAHAQQVFEALNLAPTTKPPASDQSEALKPGGRPTLTRIK